ncbi:MAG: polysaccharide pyruvyl transferase family protein [Thomasclavelia sp.]
MTKYAILTIYGMDNFGNRLQNYALQEFIKENFGEVETIENIDGIYSSDKKKVLKFHIKNWIRAHIPRNNVWKKYACFYHFNKLIKVSDIHIDSKHIPKNLYQKYDYFITGSDQVWNPNFGRISDVDFLTFAKINQRIAFSASFGISYLENNEKKFFYERIKYIPYISVREDSAKKIIEELNVETPVEVLVDPTMLIDLKKWSSIAKIPKGFPNKKYIFKYFLGNMSNEKTKELESLATSNNWEIIDILNPSDSCYVSGPAEFLYLEEHAELVITDSFHSCVFAILFNVPFKVYLRDDKNKDMSTRLLTLLTKFDLNNCLYNGKLDPSSLSVDYSNISNILNIERNKAIEFIKNTL